MFGFDTAGTTDTKRPKGYSISYDIVLSSKIARGGEDVFVSLYFFSLLLPLCLLGGLYLMPRTFHAFALLILFPILLVRTQ